MVLTPVLALAGCGSSHMNLSSPTTTRASATTSTTVSATADNGQEPAILAAYRGSLADFNQVEDTAPVNPNSPRLADHMAGEQLSSVMGALAKLASAGQVATGAVTSLHASVSQFNGTEAVVVSCERDTTAVVTVSKHKVVTPARNTNELVNDLLTLQDGVWKATQHNQVSPQCQ